MYDVVVIGGGPSGSAAACVLSRGGAKVAVLDRATFPRDKACGDMLSSASLRALERIGLTSFLESNNPEPEWRVRIQLPGNSIIRRKVFTHHEDGSPKWMTISRVELDAALIDRANRFGAEIFEGVDAKDVVDTGRRVRVVSSGVQNGGLEGHLAIIATGSMSKFGLADPELFALRGYFEGNPSEDLLLGFEKEILPGYLWRFPVRENTYNIGVGMRRELAMKFRIDRWLLGSKELDGMKQIGRFRGAFVNSSYGRKPGHANRMLWVGDAAGLVQPHLAEGLSSALRSGEIAGQAAMEALENGYFSAEDLGFYTERLDQEFGGELKISRVLHWMMNHPRLLDLTGQLLANYHSRLIRRFSSS